MVYVAVNALPKLNTELQKERIKIPANKFVLLRLQIDAMPSILIVS